MFEFRFPWSLGKIFLAVLLNGHHSQKVLLSFSPDAGKKQLFPFMKDAKAVETALSLSCLACIKHCFTDLHHLVGLPPFSLSLTLFFLCFCSLNTPVYFTPLLQGTPGLVKKQSSLDLLKKSTLQQQKKIPPLPLRCSQTRSL